MAVREIRVYGDPILRQRAVEVERVTDEVRTLARDMRDTMIADNGIGLAANQVGVPWRVIVVRVPDDYDEDAGELDFAVVNPVIKASGPMVRTQEGCLSVPGIQETVARPSHVEMEGLGLDGGGIRMALDGYGARVVQHEIDHLDGKLIVDRVSVLRKRFLRKTLSDLAQGIVPEVEVQRRGRGAL